MICQTKRERGRRRAEVRTLETISLKDKQTDGQTDRQHAYEISKECGDGRINVDLIR